MSSPDARSLPLSGEERRALSLSANGLLVADVAEKLGVPPAMVRGWLSSAIKTLGARSKLEAVLIAARTGQLDLFP